MRKLILMYVLTFISLLFFLACGDDTFCIDNISHEALNPAREDVSFTLPTGQQYSGSAFVDYKFNMGDYEMELFTAQVSETITETGAIVNLIHYFKDEKGNSFWSNDMVELINIGEIGKATANYNLNFVNGSGDFECVSGDLTVDLNGDFIEDIIDIELAGNICGGCE